MRYLPVFAAGCLLAATAFAHSPFLLPNSFRPDDRDHVTVQGAFTETFFTPDVAMKADGYEVTGPDGVQIKLTPTYLTDVALVEVKTATAGMYRVSTGLRTGRVAKAYLENGDWAFVEPGEPPPEGVEIVDMQSLTLADVYLTKGLDAGGPADAALAARGTGLELRPVSLPGALKSGGTISFELLFDGKPVAGQSVDLHKADEAYSGKSDQGAVTSDDKGQLAFAISEPGVYLAMTRYRTGPAEAGGAHRSFTVSVTFEARR
jgi:hypothetical protein